MITQIEIGLTGTRNGMLINQQELFIAILHQLKRDFKNVKFHHGDCVGADQQAHELIREYLSSAKIVIHPPVIDKYRAYCKGDVVLSPDEYLKRNRVIVDSSSWLLAFPKTKVWVPRSGTWYTINYAKKMNRKIIEL